MKKFLYSLFFFLLSFNTSYASVAGKEMEKTSENANMILSFFSTDLLINLIFAAIAIVLTFTCTKIVDSKISRFLESTGDGENREELAGVLSRTANISILAIGFSITLGVLGVDMGIFLGGLGFGLGFTMKIFLSNFIAGIIMVTNGTYHNGDLIEIDSQTGHIKKINALFTEVEQFDGIVFFVPNVKFLENNVQNFHRNSKRRVDVDVGVDYDTDILKVKKILLQVLSNFPNLLKSPNPNIFITKFDSSSINISLRFWVDSKNEDYFITKSNVTETINLAFKHAGIVIPFPQMTISNRGNSKINLENI